MPRISKAQREAREAQKAARTLDSLSRPSSSHLHTPGVALTSSSSTTPAAGGAGAAAGAAAAANPLLVSGGGVPGSGSTKGDRDREGKEPEMWAYAPGELAAGYVPTVDVSDISTSGDEGDDAWLDTAAAQGVAGAGGSGDEDDGDGDEGAAIGAKSSTAPGGTKETQCNWEDCRIVFDDMTKFIDHLHNDHVGISRSKYTCEWTGCSRRGKPQTSRFALLSHLRSHTGEKPFTCPRPECDKSFTRSDALSKHMRIQHDIQPVAARGGRGSGVTGSTNASPALSGSGATGPGSIRSSGRRSGAFGSPGKGGDEEVMEDDAHASTDYYENLPGQPMRWNYDGLFGSGSIYQGGSAAGGSTLPGRRSNARSAKMEESANSIVPVNGAGAHNAKSMAVTLSEDLGIERFASLQERLGLQVDAATIDDTEQGPVPSPFDVTLESARRNWVREMGRLQKEEMESEGGSHGAFTSSIRDSLKMEEEAGANDHEEGGDGDDHLGAASSPPPAPSGLSLFTNSPVPSAISTVNGRSSSRLSGRKSMTSPTKGSKSLPPGYTQSDSILDIPCTSTADLVTIRKACLVEEAKLDWLRCENRRLVTELEEALRQEEVARRSKRQALETCLEGELGADVRGIFTPPPSSPVQPQETMLEAAISQPLREEAQSVLQHQGREREGDQDHHRQQQQQQQTQVGANLAAVRELLAAAQASAGTAADGLTDVNTEGQSTHRGDAAIKVE